MERLPARRQGEYYVSRLRAALEHVCRHGSAEALDDELKYLSDLDAARLHGGYGLFRVIVWAIPILGFLGTVIGITMMLTGAAQMANGSDQSSMFKIFEGLGLKFDTTALALTLSMVLMFVHFFVERAENSLLEQVDRRVQSELAGRFAATAAGADGQLAAAERMGEVMMQAADAIVRRQAELWQAAVDLAARQWAQMAEAAGGAGQRRPCRPRRASLPGRPRCCSRAIDAAGEVVRLEDALNRNLSALAGAKHFEQTVLSLAAAVNMLSARLAESPGAGRSDPIGIHAAFGSRGMKFTLRPQRRRSSQTGPGISLFPFLAVLICTMGALVPLLLAITRTARLQAEAAAAAKAAEQAAKLRRRSADAAGRRAMAHRSN